MARSRRDNQVNHEIKEIHLAELIGAFARSLRTSESHVKRAAVSERNTRAGGSSCIVKFTRNEKVPLYYPLVKRVSLGSRVRAVLNAPRIADFILTPSRTHIYKCMASERARYTASGLARMVLLEQERERERERERESRADVKTEREANRGRRGARIERNKK